MTLSDADPYLLRIEGFKIALYFCPRHYQLWRETGGTGEPL